MGDTKQIHIVDEIKEDITCGGTEEIDKMWSYGYIMACKGFGIINELQWKYLEKYIDEHGKDPADHRIIEKGQAMSKTEKINKGMSDLSADELTKVIAKAQELQKQAKGA